MRVRVMVRAGDSTLHLDEAQLSGAGYAALDVVAELSNSRSVGWKPPGRARSPSRWRERGRGRPAREYSGHGPNSPTGAMSEPPKSTGGGARVGLRASGLPAVCAAALAWGALPRLAGVEPGVGLAGLLLELQPLGAVVPVGDLVGEAILDRRLGPGEEVELAPFELGEVVRHDLRDGVTLSPPLQLAVDPLLRGRGRGSPSRRPRPRCRAPRPVIDVIAVQLGQLGREDGRGRTTAVEHL